MPEKENKVKTSKKTTPKKTAAKSQSKTKSRSTTTTKKKSRSSTARKKRSRGNIIAALVILCVLLLGFNLVLVLKLVPNLKNSLKQDAGTAQTEVQQGSPSTEQKRNESLTAAQEPSPPVTVPQVAVQAQPHTDSAVQQKRQNTPAAQQKTASSQEKAPAAKKTTPAAQPAPHSPAAASAPASQTASAAQKNTAKKEKPAVHAAPQKNTVPEKSVAPDKKNTASKKNSVPEKPAVPDKKKNVQTMQPVQPAAKPEKPRKRAPYAGNLTFVFDDAGHNLDQLEHFLRLPFPCTIAVLPGLRYSSESARRIRKAGKQVILHQPMQSIDLHINPGPGAVTPGLSAEQIKNIVRKNLEEIWPVAGMNNHEGSLMTADEAAMSAVLDVVAEKHIFFLDSRTTARSVVAKVAKEKNMAVWERAIFIDNDKSRAAMETQIKKGLSIARQKGAAIMIGHVFTVELAQLLTEMYPALIEDGFSLSAIAQVAQKGTVNFGN
ncbi:divergent polysaccharide deacetylase family protein [Treponema medium]|uniref:divergent polysaccharide deacetylase family protein n=1 Tax=Treponema medium TaxID=58231 RepID=UPI00209015E5|nr:divergent polysaccharide deacetylase family protein [Treponema medium]